MKNRPTDVMSFQANAVTCKTLRVTGVPEPLPSEGVSGSAWEGTICRRFVETCREPKHWAEFLQRISASSKSILEIHFVVLGFDRSSNSTQMSSFSR
jgi:hypothetical protein